jgi:multimeric flavodoxin WrbA
MRGSKECVHDDSMNKLNNELLAADLVVLVTPLYYFGMSAQIKTVDRFYANNEQLMTSHKKAMLMATSHSADD